MGAADPFQVAMPNQCSMVPFWWTTLPIEGCLTIIIRVESDLIYFLQFGSWSYPEDMLKLNFWEDTSGKQNETEYGLGQLREEMWDKIILIYKRFVWLLSFRRMGHNVRSGCTPFTFLLRKVGI